MNTNCPTTTSRSQTATARIWIFVYGTLQRGQLNHSRYCQGALSIAPAKTWGRLYELPAGYPALMVPNQYTLVRGTTDPLVDTNIQSQYIAAFDNSGCFARPIGDWDEVHGQIIEFDDPSHRLPPIDHLEGFYPGAPSFYQRILAPIFCCGMFKPCWAYVMSGDPHCPRIRSGVWRPKCYDIDKSPYANDH